MTTLFRPSGRAFCIVALIGLALVVASPAFGQLPVATPSTPESPAPTTPEKPKIEPIAIADIASASERDKRIVQEMTDSLAPSDEVKESLEDLPKIHGRVKDVLAESERTRDSDPSILALTQLLNDWREVGIELDRVQSLLTKRGNEIEEGLKQARNTSDIWTETRKIADEQEVDRAIVDQIKSVQKAVGKLVDKAKERQGAISTRQSEVASMVELSKADLNKIEATRESLTGQILQRDQPPLWHPDFWQSADLDSVVERITDNQDRKTAAMKAFWAREYDRVIGQLILTLLVILMLRYLRPIAQEKFKGDEDTAQVEALYEHEVSLTFLLSFLYAWTWVGAKSPSLDPIVGALTLLPAVLILRRLVAPALFPILYALVGFFIVNRIRDFVSPLAVLPRVIFVIEVLVAIAFFVYWLRPARIAKISADQAQSRGFRLIGVALRGGLVALVIALLSEIAGFTALASTLTRVLSMAGYAAVVGFGAVTIIDGLVALLLKVEPLIRSSLVRRNRRLIRQKFARWTRVAAWLLWAGASLRAGDLLDPVTDGIESFLKVTIPIPEAELTLGDLMASVLVFWVALLLSRLIRFILEEEVFTRVQLAKGRPYAITTLIHYVVVTVGFLFATNALGFDLNRFTLLAGAFGVGIGFGLQTIVNNFVSGIILLTERPIDVGDTIAMGEAFGRVERIGIRSSTVRTWQGAEIIVPNADLIAQPVTNWTLSDRRRRLEIPIGVAYGSNPREVMALLVEIPKANDRVLVDPEPYVLFNGFGDSSLDFEVRGWTEEFDNYLQVRSELCASISDALAEHGITIPFPQRDLHVRTIAQPQTGDSTPSISETEVPEDLFTRSDSDPGDPGE